MKIIIDSNYKTLNMYHNNRLREIATTVDFPKDSVEISPEAKSCQRMHIPSGWKRLKDLKTYRVGELYN